jgi:DNA-binding winged helix-turn-helix (wHTH) protein/Tol biopolymer transport system component
LKANTLYIFGPYRLDPERGTLRNEEAWVNLPPKVLETLTVLVEHGGEVVSKADLMSALWPQSFVEESSLTQNIFLLRRTLGRTADGKEYIETLSKRGYRIAVPIELRTSSSAPNFLVESAPELDPISTPAVAAQPIASPPRGRGRRIPRRGLTGAVAILLAILTLAGFALRELWRGRQQPTVTRFKRLTDDGISKEGYTTLLTDGTRIYFTEKIAARSYLAEVSAGGGETTRHELPGQATTAFSYSPQRNEILLGTLWEQKSERPLSVIALPSQTVSPVGDITAHGASWSPDGQQIALTQGDRLLVSQMDGTNAHEIAKMDGVPFWPRWSPDGTRIRFSMYGFGTQPSLWEVRPDGTGLHSLLAGEPYEDFACCGDWSPDGRYFVYWVDGVSRSTLWAIRDDPHWWQSEKSSLLVEGPVDFWRAPVFAPDGGHLYALGWQARGQLLKFDATAQEFRPYLNQLSTDTLSFSPDRRWIAYTAYPEGTLWRSRPDGSERVKLSGDKVVARFPQWSPDGTQISYIASAEGNSWKINLVSAQGGKSQALVADGSNQGVPTWSPDGTRIAFGQIINFGVGQQTVRIRILDLKTGRMTGIPGSDGLWTARWSPDGRYLAAVGSKDQRLMLYDFSTSQWMVAADAGANDVVWLPDGSGLYFDSTREPVLYKYVPRSGQLTRYADLTGLRRTGFFDWTINVAPDGEPVLLREAGVQEIYSMQVNLP